MRSVFLVPIVCMLYSCNAAKVESKNEAAVSSELLIKVTPKQVAVDSIGHIRQGYMEILFVDPFVTTLIPVSCNDFERMFQKQYASRMFRIDERVFDCYTLDTASTMDVRAKLKYFYKNKEVIVCMDKYGSFYSPVKNAYLQNTQLSKLLFDGLPGWNR